MFKEICSYLKKSNNVGKRVQLKRGIYEITLWLSDFTQKDHLGIAGAGPIFSVQIYKFYPIMLTYYLSLYKCMFVSTGWAINTRNFLKPSFKCKGVILAQGPSINYVGTFLPIFDQQVPLLAFLLNMVYLLSQHFADQLIKYPLMLT